MADAVKFLVHFHWPASLSPSYAFRTLCMMLPQLHHSPSCSGAQWLGSEERAENDGDTLDWQNIRSEIRRSWRESGVTPRELLRLIQTMKQGSLTPTRLGYCYQWRIFICIWGEGGGSGGLGCSCCSPLPPRLRNIISIQSDIYAYYHYHKALILYSMSSFTVHE